MVVFLGNLPKQAVEKDLCQLARIPVETAVRIIKKKSPEGVVHRYALVPVRNEAQARRLIKRMHGMGWLGHRIAARDYRLRTGANERRRLDWRNQPWDGVERRLSERRNQAAAASSLVAA